MPVRNTTSPSMIDRSTTTPVAPPPPPAPIADVDAVVADAPITARSATANPATTADPVTTAAATRDVVAGATVDNERAQTGKAFLDGAARTDTAKPALPAATVDATDALYTPEPTTALTTAQLAAVDTAKARFAAIDDMQADPALEIAAMNAGDFGTIQDRRIAAGNDVATQAAAITDPVQREAFVRALAPTVGAAAGQVSLRSPSSAANMLQQVGKDVSADTGRLLVNEALKTGAFENLVPMGIAGSPVGDALLEHRAAAQQRIGELTGQVLQTVVPGADAAVKLTQGDVGGAVVSGGMDVLGGAVLKGGKVALGVAGALGVGTLLAPTPVEAGPANAIQRLTMKIGDAVVGVEGRVALQQGRKQTFDVAVTGAFKDGSTGALRLADERAKHNVLGNLTAANVDDVAKGLTRNKGGVVADFGIAKTQAQFLSAYNSVPGQAELAAMVMKRVTPAQLQAVGTSGNALTVPLDRVVGLTPFRGNVVEATSVRVMRNNDGSFHLVPMP